MTNTQWYAVRVNTKSALPWELGEVISIWDNYSDASEDCGKRFNAGQIGVHVTTYQNNSQSPTN